ncbi:hypothetical protein SISNIDRAFT_483688 [Sistotremastrum niveocremeum HHB9708]|uniref:Uncharacterized protein n=1 Tax=Sistotremastrum niveocremeum HHB9708 TaxID=1314777 RepID=A0A164WXJ0_9AGAM|nr:hypothetical protein SISNIDRAFT_483688 [Sistotremastrum niveocremeum HHB9708]
MSSESSQQTLDNSAQNAPLALPAPVSQEGVSQLNVGSTLKLDELGPMVVNSDGTLSRIANWREMSEIEKDRTLRVLVARNRVRLANEEKKLESQST